MNIELPSKVRNILDVLDAHGYEAYVVGGCVRDSILQRKPEDWDITTSARPEEVKALFRRTIDTGIAHGTVTVMQGDEGFEVTTYRVDGKYEDGRHPSEVTFTPNLEEDLLRRDFTINAMAYNEKAGLVDMYGGISDLEDKQLFYDAKSILQERAQRDGHDVRYEVLEESGPGHQKRFRVAAIVNGRHCGVGEGRSKKAAEQQAAYAALGGSRTRKQG